MTIRRVLITGASGFIGFPTVAAFLRAGYAVRAATRNPGAFPNSVDVVTVPDFRKAIDWAPIVRGVDVIVHLAALVHTDSSETSYRDYNEINWWKTFDLARAAKSAGVARFIFISSVRAQCGPASTHIISENDNSRPTDNYGRTKFAAELAIGASGVPFTIFRPVAIYGPHPKGNIKRLVQLSKSPLPLPLASLDGQRSLLGIDNLINAIFFALNNEATINKRFLLADQTPITLPQIVTMLRKAQGRSARLFKMPPHLMRLVLNLLGQRKLWSRISEDLVVDTSKLRALGWNPTVETYEGFCSMLSVEKGRGNE